MTALLSPRFYHEYLQQPTGESPAISIRRNPKFWPFFQDAIGAIDGTHITAMVSEADRPRYRDRKGGISQNVLSAGALDQLITRGHKAAAH